MLKTNTSHYGLQVNKIFDCPCHDAKSFYGKAKIVIDIDNEKFLLSYDTIVCYINSNGDFIKLWSGYSKTTMRHINAFRMFFDLPVINKAAWDNMPTEWH